ncbi:MAG TPA: cation:proton antiporter [Gammaproteobacteria bacterium]|nr:cation:proton antiporter [Gammaproteobacteria bacterium]
MPHDILAVILLVFFVSLFVTVIFRQLKLSVVLGYLLVGALVGPHALGIVPDTPKINELAEFGIVFLMFTIGLEFSLARLLSLKWSVYVTGILQILLSILFTTLVGKFLGMTTLSAVVIGSIVAMSSTALVAKQLNDQLELHSSHGMFALGILLLQDLAVVLLIILIAGLNGTHQQSLFMILLWALVKGMLAIALIFMMGRWLLKPLFRTIAKTRAIELFTLTVLLVTLGAAWITNMVGLSFALGAFLAGMMLAETEFRHQIAVEIRPFRDILLGLFFITIGMLTDVSQWYKTWEWIVLLFLTLSLAKMLLITLLGRLTGNSFSVSCRTGIVLAQGGEFGFALLTLALTEKILPPEYAQVALAALLLSIAFSPILIRFNKQIASFLLLKLSRDDDTLSKIEVLHATKNFRRHVIICGYGRVGQHIARLLDKVDFPYIGLDLDSELVKKAKMAGDNVIYGDPTHPEILRAARLKHAKVLVISFNDLRAAIRILSMVKPKYPSLPVLVRCHDEHELKILSEHGATQVIAELFEESLTLSHHLLHLIDVSSQKISEIMQEVRNKDYDMLKKVFTGGFNEEAVFAPEVQQLRPILIPEGAYAVNRKLKDLKLRESGIEIVAMRRDDTKQFTPNGDIVLKPNDIIIAYGTANDLEAAEDKLLDGIE